MKYIPSTSLTFSICLAIIFEPLPVGLQPSLEIKNVWYISRAAVLLCVVFDGGEDFERFERCRFR